MILVSGGFDPMHVGHMRLLQGAANYGAVMVALNSDAWLTRKKGYVFQPWAERREILLGVQGVVGVYPVDDIDGTVCEAILTLRPEAFANGGDRGPDNTPEATLCRELGIELLYEVGGGKAQSSSALVSRSWGFYRVLDEGQGFKVKRLTLLPGKTTSRQRHFRRAEHWVFLDGRYEHIPAGEWHHLENITDKPLHIIEVQQGDYCGEDDIERIPDSGTAFHIEEQNGVKTS